ncbi:MAG: arylsulfatase A family protein [bacterium]|nr:MAG: arylsulfatase A family protein [bacterium]
MPCIVRWPGKVKPGAVVDEPICHTHLLATSAAIVGAKLPDTAGEDSFSILPLLLGEKREVPTHEAVVHQAANGTLAIRQGKWKLVFLFEKDKQALELYDLSADLGETKNLAAAQPDVVQRLTRLMQKYIDDGRSTPGTKQSNDVEVPLLASPAN